MRLLALPVFLSLLASPARSDDMKDSVGLGALPGRVNTAPAAGGSGIPGFDFVPPPTPEAVRSNFWDTIRRLERKQESYGNMDSQRLVAQIYRDLASIPEAQRLDAMTRFLEIAYHYRAEQNPDNPAYVQQAHEQAFLAGVRDFRNNARRQEESTDNAAYMNLFADIRALAASGPEGRKLSEELAGLDPKNPAVERGLAADRLKAGDYDGAIAASQQAIALDGGYSQPYTTMAGAKYAQGDMKGAHRAAEQALAVDPQDQLATSILKLTDDMQLSQIGKPGDFSDGDRQTPSYAPGSSPYPAAQDSAGAAAARKLSESAGAAFAAGDYAKAAELASRAMAADASNPTAPYWRGAADMRMGRLSSALADAETAGRLVSGRTDPALLLLRAEILNRMDRHSEALDAAEKGLAAEPDTAVKAELFFQKAWALAGLGRRQDAVAALASAARLDGRFEPYYQKMLTLPEDADLTALFKGSLQPRAQQEAPKDAAQAPGSRWRLMLMLLLSSVTGGLLIALGILQFSGSGGWRERVRTAFGVPEPALSEPLAAPGPALDLAAPDLAENDTLAGTYHINRRIGTGGMGVVYEAFDRNLERRVAIKKLRTEISADPGARERILREARTVAQLRHPNIVEIYSVVSASAGIYLVFELVDGRTVHEYIQRHGRLSFGWSLNILRSAAAALDYAHRRDIIHRDLKPSNIMIDSEGMVKVMDFGVARPAKDTLGRSTPRSTSSGTPQYMAPEQDQGRPRKESDVYAMGVTLYEMVTGRLPFSGTGSGIALNKLNNAYVPPSLIAPELPPHFDRVLSWALTPDPNKRWRTPGQFVQALAALNPAPGGPPRMAPPAGPDQQWGMTA